MSLQAVSWALYGDHGELDPTSKLVLIVLADHAGEHGLAWPSRPTIARAVGCSVDTVDRRIRRLIDDGLVEYAGENYLPAAYAEIPVDRRPRAYRLAGPQAAASRGRRMRRPGPQNAATGVAELCGPNPKNPKNIARARDVLWVLWEQRARARRPTDPHPGPVRRADRVRRTRGRRARRPQGPPRPHQGAARIMTRYRKTIVAVVGAVLTFLYFAQAQDLIGEPAQSWLLVVLLTATSLGVWAVPNTDRVDWS